jgi:hypothetical protein
VISARDDIDSPLSMPHDDHRFAGISYVMHRGCFAGIFRDACRALAGALPARLDLAEITKCFSV